VTWQPGDLGAVREDTVGPTVLRLKSKGSYSLYVIRCLIGNDNDNGWS